MVGDWYLTTIEGLQNLWKSILGFVPNLIGVIIVFIIGWFISVGIGKLIASVLQKLKVDRLLDAKGLKEVLERAEIKIKPSEFIGAICKWILVIVFLLVAVEILGFVEFAGFLKSILAYLPNVVVAVLILVVTVILVDIVEKIVRTAVEGIKVGYGHLASAIIKWSIWIFAILAILHQLGVARPFMETLFTGIVAMLVLAIGISFGLGGKEVAADILQNLRKKLQG